MPLLKIQTNTKLSNDQRDAVLKKASRVVAQQLGKPESENPTHKYGMSALFSGGCLARRDEGAWPQRPVTEEQRRQTASRKQPAGLPIFGAAAALLVGRRSIKDILPPRALQQRQIPGNALVPYL